VTSFAQLGNDLYTGKRAIDFVGRQKIWYALSGVILLLSLVGIFGRHLNLGLEFRGGSEFRVSQVATTAGFEDKGRAAVRAVNSATDVVVTRVGGDSVRLQTEHLTDAQTTRLINSLATTYGVPSSNVTSSFIGASWGASVSQKAVTALLWFLVLVSLVLALYFRTWTMALAGLVALLHDMVITVGIYALAGFEITPASMIGFLTILGYSLYDTVVVFDKVRENTNAAVAGGRQSYSQAANSAVNQTLVRSINTSVVALLPVGSILLIGIFLLGPGTLLDLALALFVGIAAGTYSSIFIATPLLADLREREPAMKALAGRAARYQASRARQGAPAAAAVGGGGTPGRRSGATAVLPDDGRIAGATVGATPDGTLEGHDAAASRRSGARPLHPSVTTGPRNQPRRPPKSKR
jgi:preprotein translocase subunit SecF